VKVPTSGSGSFAAAVALTGSLQPANSGAIAANIKMMHADCVRSPDMKALPQLKLMRELSIRGVAVGDRRDSTVDAKRIRRHCCNAIRRRGGSMSHEAIALNQRRFFVTHSIVSRVDCKLGKKI
jgi:hypothetical protein